MTLMCSLGVRRGFYDYDLVKKQMPEEDLAPTLVSHGWLNKITTKSKVQFIISLKVLI